MSAEVKKPEGSKQSVIKVESKSTADSKSAPGKVSEVKKGSEVKQSSENKPGATPASVASAVTAAAEVKKVADSKPPSSKPPSSPAIQVTSRVVAKPERPKGPPQVVTLRGGAGARPHSNSKRGTMGMEVCEECGERVFLMERLGVENRVFHRTCFKCSTCHCKLKAGSYEYDTHSDKFYCRQHYREALRTQTITRAMAERGLSFETKPQQPAAVNGVKKVVSSGRGPQTKPPSASGPVPAGSITSSTAVEKKGERVVSSDKKQSPRTVRKAPEKPSPPPPYSDAAKLPKSTISYLTKGKSVVDGRPDQQATPTSTPIVQEGGAKENGSGSPIPTKPPRRKKHSAESTHSIPEEEAAPGKEPDKPDRPVKRESIRPKRAAPPRPTHPPYLRTRGLSQGKGPVKYR